MRAPNRRAVLRGGVGLSAVASGVLAAPHVNAQGGKPYAGTTINGSCFQTTYFEYLKNYFPQFEEKTGIKVNFTMQAFPVYNQRTDLELSTKGSAMDVCNVTFIYSGRWIGAGWMTPLDPFFKDTKYTPADWDADDFVEGAQDLQFVADEVRQPEGKECQACVDDWHQRGWLFPAAPRARAVLRIDHQPTALR